MRFFTRDWATGGLTDEDYEKAFDRYRDHLAQLDLPANVLGVAEASIHDGLVLKVEEAPGELSLTLVTGDLQQGYFETTIRYADPLAWGATITFLQCAAGNSNLDVVQHEIDRLDTRFIHRMLFSSHEEACVVFSSASVTQVRRNSRTLGTDSSTA